MLFKEIIAVYSENHMKNINTPREQNADLSNVKVGGIVKIILISPSSANF
jgi:hypothetical protein